MNETPQRPQPFQRAEIVAVGAELLTPLRVDTNSLFLTGRLNELGIEVRVKTIVGDTCEDLSQVFRHAFDRSDLVIMCGGLGPTDDDLTRAVVAEVLDLPLVEDERIVDHIRRRFDSRGLRMPEINRRQAMVPRGAVALDNAHGTAPGLWIERQGKAVLLLPGPPRELEPMFDTLVRPRLMARAGHQRLVRRVLRIAGRTESHVEEAAQPVYSRWQTQAHPIRTTILAAPGQIELHLMTQAATQEDGHTILDRATDELAAVLGRDLYSVDGRGIEQVVGQMLRERQLRVAIAESCTGGLIASRLTDVPGSSDYVELGVVAYSDHAKIELLGVPDALIREHGAVSEAVAMAMATGARVRAATHIGIGVTGIAGPGGGTERKPVGTVSIAVAGPDDSGRARTVRFPGGREQVKLQASQAALDMLRRRLMRS